MMQVNYLYGENDNMQKFISFLFECDDLYGCKMYASKPTGMVKPDITIRIDNITKYISVKKVLEIVSIKKKSVFENYLRSCGMENRIIAYLKEFHY